MTSTFPLTTPIGEAARLRPDLLPLFDRLGLDYCCNGRRSIAEACRAAGAEPATLIREIESASFTRDRPPATEPEASSMSALCDEIESTHHAFVRDSFSRLAALMPRVLGAHAQSHPFLRDLDAALRDLEHDLADHMIREERVLFPWLRRLEQPGAVTVGPPWSVQRPIDCMEHDHDDVAEAFVRIRALTDDYTPPGDACTSFAALMTLLSDLERDTRRHIHKENNILFPAGLRAEGARAPLSTGGAR